MEHNKDIIETYLHTDSANDSPSSEWKKSLILDIEKHIQKKKHKRIWLVSMSVTTFALAVGIVVVFQPQQPSITDQFAAGPQYIASPWAKRNVRYSFADTLNWSGYVEQSTIEYMPITREYTDTVAQQFDPAFLEQAVEQTDDGRILYRTAEKVVEFHDPKTQGGTFEMTLFTAPEGAEFSKQDNITISYEEQVAQVQQFIEDYPLLNIGDQYEFLPDKTYGANVAAIQKTIGAYSYEPLRVTFYNGKIYRVVGTILKDTHSTEPLYYGSKEEVLDYINSNPIFSIHFADDTPDVAIEYMITHYEMTQEGLRLHCVLTSDIEQIAQRLNQPQSFFNGIQQGDILLPLPKDRK